MDKLFVFLADATDTVKDGIKQACGGGACNKDLTLGELFKNIGNALIFVIGAVAVIMIIVGGLRYVLSNGDAKAAAAGKDTILYAVVGLVFAVASYAIVNFVLVSIK
jgi:hypothetical protein